jgi:hypothetical protein
MDNFKKTKVNLECINIYSSSFNSAYYFLDITISRKSFSEWLKLNNGIINKTHLMTSWVSSDDDQVKDYEIERREKILSEHQISESLSCTSSKMFKILSEKVHEIGVVSYSGHLSIPKKSFEFNFYTNEKKALDFFENIKNSFPNDFIGIEKINKGQFSVFISSDKKIEKLRIGETIKKRNKNTKTLVLTLDEIAKKFNVDVKNLKIKNL